jgi:CubicO group peptidase (beta-lactamase class C family)
MTPEFEARIKKAVDDGVLPNAVLLAKDKSGMLSPLPHLILLTPSLTPQTGKMDYTFSHGPVSLKPDSPPISPTTMLTMASMSKLITSLCVLHLVQDKILEINEDITAYVPTLTSQPILTGFDATGSPILKPRTKPITLRHLLTHSAGTGYIFVDERLARWARATGRPLPIPLKHSPVSGGMSIDSRFNYPLLFEPGEGWVYGSGLDWAGRLIEKLTGAFFDDFMYEKVLKPVGVPKGGITFHPGRFQEKTVDLLAGMALRDAETGKVGFMATEVDPDNEGFGGEGLYGGMGEYMKVLHSVLMDDGKILKPEVTKWLFEPLLEPVERKALNENLRSPEWAVGHIPKGVDFDWSAGGLVSTGGELKHRKKGFLQWGGAWNLCWVSTASYFGHGHDADTLAVC